MTTLQKKWIGIRAPRHFYSSEEEEFLRRIVRGKSSSEINTLFNERFGVEMSFCQLVKKMQRMGLGNEKKHLYTPDEICFIKEKITGRSYSEFQKLFNERFGVDMSLHQLRIKIHRMRLSNGLNNNFKPGHSINSKPIGSENSEKFIKVKISDKVWKPKHHIVWEKARGPMPKDHVIIFADGNKLNFALDNLLLFSKREMAMANRFGLSSPGQKLNKTGLLIARLKLLLADRERELTEKDMTI